MKQIVIAISGRKSAGKNTLCKFIKEYSYNNFLYNNVKLCNHFDTQNNRISKISDFFYETSFADDLKEFCINVLGLSYEQCYGSESEKNQLTEYRWENISPLLQHKFKTKQLESPLFSTQQRTGFLSGREVMQIFGTELIRETFGNVWTKSTFRRIVRINKLFSIITDLRFPNEVFSTLEHPFSYIIRLTRSPFGNSDNHASESALDNFNWTKEHCFVIDNNEMSINEQNNATKDILNNIFEDFKNELIA